MRAIWHTHTHKVITTMRHRLQSSHALQWEGPDRHKSQKKLRDRYQNSHRTITRAIPQVVHVGFSQTRRAPREMSIENLKTNVLLRSLSTFAYFFTEIYKELRSPRKTSLRPPKYLLHLPSKIISMYQIKNIDCFAKPVDLSKPHPRSPNSAAATSPQNHLLGMPLLRLRQIPT